MIHKSAIIHETAKIGKDVEIGPWSIIGADVEIGDGTWIGPHVVISGPTKIGTNNKIYQFASVGEDSQDKKFVGQNAWLEIGNDNVIREFCTINRGSLEGSKTIIGNENLFMAYVHIAHDCIVGNSTIFANNATLAGHVTVDDFAILSGFSGSFQFCHIGKHAFLSMGAQVEKDVLPFVKVAGFKAKPYGLNTVGMKRRGFASETMLNLRRAYKAVYREGLTVKKALVQLENMVSDCPEVQMFIDFIENSERGLVR